MPRHGSSIVQLLSLRASLGGKKDTGGTTLLERQGRFRTSQEAFDEGKSIGRERSGYLLLLELKTPADFMVQGVW